MKKHAFGAFLLAASVAALPAAPPKKADPKIDGPNLILNGDFEEGGASPAHWQTVDGLTTFYVKDPDPKHNKCVKLDTDVLQSQGYEWWARFALAETESAALRLAGQEWLARAFVPPPAKDAPKKLPTVEPKYDTLAGLDGVWYWSDYIPVEKGKAYWLTFDCKGVPGADVKAWLVGYPEKQPVAFGSEAKALIGFLKEQRLPKNAPNERMKEPVIAKYIYRGQLSAAPGATWQTFSRKDKLFKPTSVTPNVKWVRVMILPYWPPGEYYLDNVRLVEVPDPDAPKEE
jgi:hypothetical protein